MEFFKFIIGIDTGDQDKFVLDFSVPNRYDINKDNLK